MTKYLFLLSDVAGEPMERAEAIARYHDFTSWVYLTPVLGAFLADTVLGKYRTILSLSIVYCLGHLRWRLWVGREWCRELDDDRALSDCSWLRRHQALCVRSRWRPIWENQQSLAYEGLRLVLHLDQRRRCTVHARNTLLLEWYGPHWAFGVPIVLMAIATVLFWMGRNVFIHIPPRGKAIGPKAFLRFSSSLLSLSSSPFGLFDQTGSSWVLQAEDLDRNWLGIEWLPSQIQAVNPVMIVTLVPLFSYVIYPAIDKIFPLTALRKIAIGLFVMVPGFAIVAMLQSWIDAGETPNISWQLFAYAVLTASEVMLSITCLEFAYTYSYK